MTRSSLHRLRGAVARAQRGVVLFIALIVLVALSLAGLAIMRSTETTTLVAGNLAFKQATLQASDQGVRVAFDWLLANRTALATTNTAVGYFSSRPAGEPDWTQDASWVTRVDLPADAIGNQVSYVIHRMCSEPNVAYNGIGGTGLPNQCALDTSTGGGSTAMTQGDSFGVGNNVFSGDPRVVYRITTRTIGPRNAMSITQAMVAMPI